MHIAILGKKIPVILKSAQSMRGHYGYFLHEEEAIYLKKSMKQEHRRQTLSHECFHAFLYLTGHNELLRDISENYEESLTRGFEAALGNYFVFPKPIEDWIAGP